MDGTVAPASLVASPSYVRAVLPAARAVSTTQVGGGLSCWSGDAIAPHHPGTLPAQAICPIRRIQPVPAAHQPARTPAPPAHCVLTRWRYLVLLGMHDSLPGALYPQWP